MVRKTATRIDEKWQELAAAAKQEAQELPDGKKREALLRKVRQLEFASQLDLWLASPGLMPPK